MDRAGMVGSDGATHQGAYDIAFMRCVPNLIVSAPMNEEELRNLMYTAQQDDMGPFAIRYPRGEGVMPEWRTPFKALEVGKGRKICDGEDIAILSIGHPGNFAVKANQILNLNEIYPAHYDMRFVKPLDEALLHHVFKNYPKIITVEDGCLMGGFGSAVLEWAADHGYNNEVKRLGIPDKFIDHAEPAEQYKECGFHMEDIVKAVQTMLGVRVRMDLIANI
jgi:1-deoxy-D-xylulose-5-phosphate synthase